MMHRERERRRLSTRRGRCGLEPPSAPTACLARLDSVNAEILAHQVELRPQAIDADREVVRILPHAEHRVVDRQMDCVVDRRPSTDDLRLHDVEHAERRFVEDVDLAWARRHDPAAAVEPGQRLVVAIGQSMRAYPVAGVDDQNAETVCESRGDNRTAGTGADHADVIVRAEVGTRGRGALG